MFISPKIRKKNNGWEGGRGEEGGGRRREREYLLNTELFSFNYRILTFLFEIVSDSK